MPLKTLPNAASETRYLDLDEAESESSPDVMVVIRNVYEIGLDSVLPRAKARFARELRCILQKCPSVF